MFHGHLDYFQNHLSEVGLIQHRETMALSKFTTVDLLYFIMWEDPAWIEIHWNSIGWGPGHLWLHTTLEGPWPRYMILEVSWDALWTLLLGSHNFMVMALGLCVERPLVVATTTTTNLDHVITTPKKPLNLKIKSEVTQTQCQPFGESFHHLTLAPKSIANSP